MNSVGSPNLWQQQAVIRHVVPVLPLLAREARVKVRILDIDELHQCDLWWQKLSHHVGQRPGNRCSVAFCSPAISLAFGGLMENPLVGNS